MHDDRAADEIRKAYDGVDELRVVEVEETGAQALSLAVDDAKDLHLLAFRQADEAHEGKQE